MRAPDRLNTEAASWVVTIAMTIMAGALRLVNLNRVKTLLFDETYYVKDAWSLRVLGYEGTWATNSDAAFIAGDTSGLSPIGSFVVHPPLGKWLIAGGMGLLGQSNPVGWRLASAVAGTVTVLLLCRLMRILFHSTLATLLAGMFLATDGMHVVMSRIAILDVFLGAFILAAFVAVAKDSGKGTRRPWLWVAGVMLGCACAVKWSGIYAIAALGLFVVIREMVAKRRSGEPWFWKIIFPDGVIAFVALVGAAAVTYLATWLPWFFHPNAWGNPNLVQYQRDILSFHTELDGDHPYRSHPWTWLFQLRPTAFWFEKGEETVEFITALGNPLLWWFGFVALVLVVGAFVRYRTWQSALLIVGYFATYVPWFLFPHRTMFTFYTVTIAPFVAAVSACVIAWMAGALPLLAGSPLESMYKNASHSARLLLTAIAIILTFTIVACAVYFSPIWMGTPITTEMWQTRMWLATWI